MNACMLCCIILAVVLAIIGYTGLGNGEIEIAKIGSYLSMLLFLILLVIDTFWNRNKP